MSSSSKGRPSRRAAVYLAVEEDSLPLHVIGMEPLEVEREVMRLVAGDQDLQTRYGGFLASLHSKAWKEFEAIARSKGKQALFDLRPAIQSLGWDCLIEQVGLERVIEQVGEQRVIKAIGLDKFLNSLSPAERRELKRRLQNDRE
jgi:hypothetical protein